jgi:hypothetical protein
MGYQLPAQLHANYMQTNYLYSGVINALKDKKII